MRYPALRFAILCTIVLAGTVCMSSSKPAWAKETTIDFTDWKKWRVPVDPARVAEIAAMLDEKPQGVGAPIDQRDYWDRFAKSGAAKVIKQGEKYAKISLPEFSEELYLDYFDGSKRRDPYARGYRYPIVNRFNSLTVAECLENQGRFLPELEETLKTICEMRSWTDPWHDRSLDSFKKGIPQIALESSLLANQVATANYWLGNQLSPELHKRISAELDRRTFQPFEKSIRKKQGKREWWITGTNNWNPVCLNGVVRAALTEIESKERRAFFIAAAEQSVRYFFKGFSPNGYCDEGVGYWGYGVGNYAQLAEAVYQATDGKVDWFKHSPAADIPGTPSVADIALYPERIRITPKISPSFADCSTKARASLYALTILRRRLNLPGPAYSASDVEKRNVGSASISNYQNIPIYAALEKTSDAKSPKDSAASHVNTEEAQFNSLRSYYDRHGVYVGRPGEDTKARLSIAVLGGHNAESHNHNDVGTYIVVCDDKTPIIDPGSEVYTRRTFSPQRYESNVINSFGHPVPKVAGKLQSKGRDAKGEIALTNFTDKIDRLKMDMTSSYKVKTLHSLTRRFVYSRDGEGKITVIDTVNFSRPEAFESALITLEPWEQIAKDRIRIGKGKGAIEVKVSCRACPIQIKPTTIHEDLSSVKGRDNEVTRLGLVLTKPVTKAVIIVNIEPCKL